MKLISLIILCFLSESTFAITYYFSTTDGDDKRSNVQAEHSNTPWKTLVKLNEIFGTLKPGDKILLKRGDVFNGSIYANASGTAALPILISAYGTGNKPVITGLTTLINWTLLSNKKWENAGPGFGTSVNIVLINGVFQNIGRHPNISTNNGGYLTFESHNGTNSITDNELTDTTNWTGAELVIRKSRWVLDRNILVSRNNKTINYTSATTNIPLDNFGYFMQNHPSSLDLFGEWYFDSNTRKLGIFLNNNPSSYIIKASQIKNLISLYNLNYISLDNLKIEGANDNAIDIFNASNLVISNCDIVLSGINGINGLNADKISINNSTVSNTNNNAINLRNCSNFTITDNKITTTGAVAGMGQSGDGNYNGLLIIGSGNLVKYNEIKNTGYLPINFSGSETIIQNNLIDTFAFVKDDAGGIYIYDGLDSMPYPGRKIIGNIILNGLGAPAGTSDLNYLHACGIFIDNANLSGLEIRDNTLSASNRGIFIFRSSKINMRNNTCYNNNLQLSLSKTNGSDFYDNIFFSKFPRQIVSHLDATQGPLETQNKIITYGNFDSNYYARPLDDDMIIYSADYNNAGTVIIDGFDLPGWKAKYNKDNASKTSPLKYPAYKINSLIGANIFDNGKFNSNIQGVYSYAPLNNIVTSYSTAGGLDGGSLQVSFNSTSKSSRSNTSLVMIDIGTVTASKQYILKFSLKGSTNSVSINAYLRNFEYPYSAFTASQYRKISTTRTENEVLFSFPKSGAATLVFGVDNQNVKYWVDNIQLYEADVKINNPDDNIRFEYNATKVNKIIPLNGNYVDVANKNYSGSVTLLPYSSVILLKKPETSNSSGILEAEEALLSKAAVNSYWTGFTGSGYADYTNNTGDFIEWTLNKTNPGKVALNFRYGNGSSANRPLKLTVNGTVVSSSLAFPSTTTWDNWSTKSFTANLISGANKIRLTTIGSNGGNIDHLAWNDVSSRSNVNLPLEDIPGVQPDFSASVVPNPASGTARLYLKTSSDLPLKLDIIDILGKSHKNFSYGNFRSGYFNLSVSNLPSGTYFIIAKQGIERTTTRLVIK